MRTIKVFTQKSILIYAFCTCSPLSGHVLCNLLVPARGSNFTSLAHTHTHTQCYICEYECLPCEPSIFYPDSYSGLCMRSVHVSAGTCNLIVPALGSSHTPVKLIGTILFQGFLRICDMHAHAHLFSDRRFFLGFFAAVAVIQPSDDALSAKTSLWTTVLVFFHPRQQSRRLGHTQPTDQKTKVLPGCMWCQLH